MNNNGGIGIGGFLFGIFLVLKLTDYIDWSWWWVTAPLWIPAAIVFVVTSVVAAVTAATSGPTIKRRK